MTTPAVHATDLRESPQTGQSTQVEQTVHLHVRLDAPVGRVWQALVSPAGTAVWLGPGAVLREKGQSYHCTDGTVGVVRSFHPLEQLRLSWHRDAESEPSLIEVDLSVSGAGTSLRLWHDGLPVDQRPAMLAHWRERLDAFTETLS